MSKFLVMYLVPVAVIEDWKKTDAEIRKPAEEKMREQWDAWMGEHGHAVTATEAAGRTKLVSKDGISDTKNDLMLYSIVEAPSHDDRGRDVCGPSPSADPAILDRDHGSESDGWPAGLIPAI